MKPKYLKNVVSLSYDIEGCIGCGKCVEVCPRGIFDLDGTRARIVQRDSCMECGACALNCPAETIEVNAGVGCAAAIIMGWFTGKEPSCSCDGGKCC